MRIHKPADIWIKTFPGRSALFARVMKLEMMEMRSEPRVAVGVYLSVPGPRGVLCRPGS